MLASSAISVGIALALAGDGADSGAGSWMMLVVPFVCALAGACFVVCTRRWLSVPMQSLAESLASMSIGRCDLRARLRMSRTDEVGIVATYFDAFVDRVQEALSTASGLSSDAHGASNVIARESRRLADSSSTNAATIEEIMASLTEINELTSTSSKSCEEASRRADCAREAVTRGNSDCDRLTAAMAEILESSDTINKVVAVIQDVSFQTNLLALNAAVEAARAGESGKGFAVVAEEVRTLAQRSAAAAKETSDLIEEANRRAENGGRIAEEVANVLGEIQTETVQVGGLLEGAAAEVLRQRDSVSMVTNGINSISESTQEHASSAEGLAVASRDSSEKITRLQELVGQFELGEGPVAGT